MESPEAVVARLDSEFDRMLADMKPHVLRLPHKSDRQKCAQWIKKFCDPPASGISGRKNRNMYCQLLLHMLRRGMLDGPFANRPEPGHLPTLPDYMSVYLDDLLSSKPGISSRSGIPEWVNGELTSEMGSVISSLWSPTFDTMSIQQGPKDILSSSLPSPIRSQSASALFAGLELGIKGPITTSGAFGGKNPKDILFPSGSTGIMERKPYDSSTFSTSNNITSGSSFKDDSNTVKLHEREMDMKGKVLEARFQEEKLRLQQKHDATVQKILDRKNSEIEELKGHYRAKTKEQETNIGKLEKKVNHLQRELQSLKDAKEQQIQEMKRNHEDVLLKKQNNHEKKLHDTVAKFEQEKFDIQKQHTKNIQELLEDTNNRLHKMEEEYNMQQQQTSIVVRELEARVQQLASEGEVSAQLRAQLERDKYDLKMELDRAMTELAAFKARCEQQEQDTKREKFENEQDFKSAKHKLEASIEFLKQEHNIASAKANDTIADLEHHVNQLKQAMENAEQQKQRQIRMTGIEDSLSFGGEGNRIKPHDSAVHSYEHHEWQICSELTQVRRRPDSQTLHDSDYKALGTKRRQFARQTNVPHSEWNCPTESAYINSQ